MSATAHPTVGEIVSQEEFQARVLGSQVPVLVDLWAPWCAPCRAQSPILEQVAQEAGDRAVVVKINVDEAGELAQNLRVSSIPTLILFADGRERQRFVGLQSAALLKSALGL